jgi:adenylate cyclase
VSAVGLLLALALPLGFLALVIEHPSVDGRWENHAAHFWIVLAAASANAALGYAVSVAGRRRRDARLFLVSLAFIWACTRSPLRAS